MNSKNTNTMRGNTYAVDKYAETTTNTNTTTSTSTITTTTNNNDVNDINMNDMYINPKKQQFYQSKLPYYCIY